MRMTFSFVSVLILFNLLLISPLNAQQPERNSAAEIQHAIDGLDEVGSVLYLAAHPDDENTQMISWFSNERHLRTGYLSLTRGDGGQNLLGPEIRELLGVLRTQELMQARDVDGGIQFFTRANDFGYSKKSEETLEIWNKEEVLSDIVWTIRKFRPDIIINRFNHEGDRRTHGHHSASAKLSLEAYELAADSTAFPEQLKYLDPWQPKRLFFNTSWWFYGSREAFEKADKSNLISVDVGTYFPLLGASNTEISATSRSQHKSQGFGRLSERGKEIEYLELIEQTRSFGMEDPFSGINTDWSRLKNGASLNNLFQRIEMTFTPSDPAASIPQLLDAYEQVQQIENEHWKEIKSRQIEEIIYDCAGFYFEAVADQHYAIPGQTMPVNIEVINRSNAAVQLNEISVLPSQKDTVLDLSLDNNTDHTFSTKIELPGNADYTTPYWLKKPDSKGMYTVENQQLRGLPVTPNPHKVQFHTTLFGQEMTFDRPLVYKERDPVVGEAYRPFEIVPNFSVSASESNMIFADRYEKTVQLTATSHMPGKQSATLKLNAPNTWRISPQNVEIEWDGKGDEEVVTFTITPPKQATTADMTAQIQWQGEIFDRELTEISYDHIPTQTVLQPAELKAVKLDLKKAGEHIGYISGAGDDIPSSLQQIGYEVTILDPEQIRTIDKLNPYDALVIGIRAYNTLPQMKNLHDVLMKYVEGGGTIVAQYSKSYGLMTDKIGPYPFQLSHDRVTVEDAPVEFLVPDHPVLNTPNNITQEDFEGWVQERGLYFADEWDDRYTPILSSHDPGEEPVKGGLLVAEYGKGHFIYTGYSWFRELPAGVPGAYRIFTNLISLGQNSNP